MVPVTLRTLDVWRNPGKPEPDLAAAAPRVRPGRIGQERRPGLGGAGPVVAREAEAGVRAYVRRLVARFVKPRSVQSAAIVTAILIGDRARLESGHPAPTQTAGTYHVIAISGGNVALLTLVCFLATRLLARERAPRPS